MVARTFLFSSMVGVILCLAFPFAATARAETLFFGQSEDPNVAAFPAGQGFDTWSEGPRWGVESLNDFTVGESPPLDIAFYNGVFEVDVATGSLSDGPGVIDEGDNNPIFETEYLRVFEPGTLSFDLDQDITGFGFYGGEAGQATMEVTAFSGGSPVGGWEIATDDSGDPFFWGVISDAAFDQIIISDTAGGYALDAPRVWLPSDAAPQPAWYASSNVENGDFQVNGGSLDGWTPHTAASTDSAVAANQGEGNHAAVLHAQGNDDSGGYVRGESRLEQTVYIPLDATRIAFVYRTDETEGGTDDYEARVGFGRGWDAQWKALGEQPGWAEDELVIEDHRKGKAREVQLEVTEPEGGSESGEWMELQADWVHVDGTPCDYSHAEWDSTAGGDFNSPASWSTGAVPVNQWNAPETAFVKAADVTLPDVGSSFGAVTVTGSHFVNEFACERGSETVGGLVIEENGALETWESATVSSSGNLHVESGGRFAALQSFSVKYGGQVHVTGAGVRNDDGDLAVGHRLYVGYDGRLYVTDATLKTGSGLSVYGDTSQAEFVSSSPGDAETVLLVNDVYIRGGSLLFGEGTRTELDQDFRIRENSSGDPAHIQFDGLLYMGGDFEVEAGADLTYVDFSSAKIIFHNDADSQMDVRGTGSDPFCVGRLELESGNLTLVGAPDDGYLCVDELVLTGPGTLDLGGMTLEYNVLTGDPEQVTGGTLIPEPATVLLLGLGGIGIVRRRRG